MLQSPNVATTFPRKKWSGHRQKELTYLFPQTPVFIIWSQCGLPWRIKFPTSFNHNRGWWFIPVHWSDYQLPSFFLENNWIRCVWKTWKWLQFRMWVLPVKAFIKVDNDLFNILKKGSLHGYFWEPQRTVCSRTCGTPVLSIGVVRNCTLRQRKRNKFSGESYLEYCLTEFLNMWLPGIKNKHNNHLGITIFKWNVF